MKKHLQHYRPFLSFLVKFFAVYGGLTLLYKWYLSQYDSLIAFQMDGITTSVANQVQAVARFFGYGCQLEWHTSQSSIKLILDGHYVSRIVEGCNAVSVVVLFIAFIVAFSGKWIQTLAYLIIGSILIHLMNVLRIVFLSIALLHYPEQEPILHGVVFPLIIYGFVFGLWVIWVNYFSTYAERKEK